jgi:alpha-1,6-mannosyltransferase
MRNIKRTYWFLIFFTVIAYAFVGYFIPRYETGYLLVAVGFLFLSYIWIVTNVQEEEVFTWLIIALCFRLIFLVALPSLSEDFYRFIWDGRLWLTGHHPFAKLPAAYLQLGIHGVDQSLFEKLNSQPYFTIYPPVSQFIFWLSVKIFPESILGSVIVMRVIIFFAEVGTILIIRKLLREFSLSAQNVLLYALNPLVIIELIGNLHFESLVIFFVFLSILLLMRFRLLFSAAGLSLAIGTKLVPVIFLPSLIWFIGIKRSVTYGLAVLFFLILCFLPLFDQAAFQAMTESVGLYFNKFEFNASLYYLVREVGFWKYGYNIIQTVGWKLGLVAALLIVFISFRKGLHIHSEVNSLRVQEMLLQIMWALCIYFLFTTTLHPWYITTLVSISVFSLYRFPVLWSGLIFLTYAGYDIDSFQENYWLTAFEYVAVIGYFIFELNKNSNFKFNLSR